MEYRQLGRAGMRVSVVRGRCEETLGQALKGRWDRFVVATKGGLPMGEGPNDRGASRYHLRHPGRLNGLGRGTWARHA